MDNNIEILISGNTSGFTAGGSLTLYGNEPINLSLSIADVKDIKKRKTPFSQTFTVPADKNNNKLFSHLFNVGADGKYNPKKKAKASIIENSIPVIEGNMQLMQIGMRNGISATYELTVLAETDDFFSKIEGEYLTDMNFSALTHICAPINAVTSWSTLGNYYYPLIDYGFGWDYNVINNAGVNMQQLYPAISVKYLFDGIFREAGYTYTSSFFEDDVEFEELYIPFNGDRKTVNSPTFRNNRLFIATGLTNGIQKFSGYTQTGTYEWSKKFFLSGATATLDPSGGFTNDPGGFSQFENLGLGSAQKHILNITFDIPGVPSASTMSNVTEVYLKAHFLRSRYGIYDSTPFYSVSSPKYDTPDFGVSGQTITFETPWLNGAIPGNLESLQQNDEVRIELEFLIKTNASWLFPPHESVRITNIIWKNDVSLELVEQGIVDYSYFIPKNIKKTDFINSIFKMFNVYVEPSKIQPNNLILNPRDIYYASGETKNWSDKLDLSRPITEKLLSELTSKKIEFSYSKDLDYYNDYYQKSKNLTYGNCLIDIENDFTKGTNKIDVIFSPTPLASLPLSNNFVLPQIYKITNNTYASTTSKLRILRRSRTPLPIGNNQTFKLLNYPFVGSSTSFSAFPYIGHLNHPTTGTTDLNFGQVDYVFYSLSSITPYNLVERFYRQYLNQIIDKDGKLITAYLKLNNRDIYDFKFSDKVFIDGISPEGGAYYYVQKIDYPVTSNEPSKCELLKVKTLAVNPVVKILESPPADADASSRIGSILLDGGNSNTSGNIIAGENSYSSSRNSLILGSNNLIFDDSNNSSIIGNNNFIDNTSTGNTISGDNNRILNNTFNSNVFGNDNEIEYASSESFVVGSNNRIISTNLDLYGSTGTTGVTSVISATTGSVIFGSNNVVMSGVTGAIIFGDNITGTTNDMTYLNNISIYSSITISPTATLILSGTSLNIWSSSTGSNSIIANNGSGNFVGVSFSNILGGNGNYIN